MSTRKIHRVSTCARRRSFFSQTSKTASNVLDERSSQMEPLILYKIQCTVLVV